MKIFEIKNVRQELYINILFGLISIYKFSGICFDLKFLNILFFRISKYYKRGVLRNFYELFPSSDIKAEVREECLKQIIEQVPSGAKNIVMIRSGLGETYLLNLYLKQYMQKYNLSFDNTYFVGLRENFAELFKQYNPEIHYKKIGLNWDYLSFAIEKDFYSQDDRNIFVYINKDFIYKLMNTYKNSDNPEHYVRAVQNLFEFKPDEINSAFCADSNQRLLVLNKLKKSGLNINKFIFVSPDALSIYPLSNHFWEELEANLKHKGYDIFVNSKAFTITEAKIIASYSKGIIGMRSGFIETLLELNKPMHIIYTPMLINNMPADKFCKAHSLVFYPYTKKELIFEYENQNNNEKLIMEEIVRRFE